jgi:hypothetical protein
MRTLVALLGFGSSLAHAGVVEKGVRGGFAIMSINTSNSNSSGAGSTAINPTPGFAVGAWVTWHLSGVLSIQTEAQVTEKHLYEEHCAPCMTLDTLVLWYLELPILLRFDVLPDGSKGRVHFDLGPAPVITMGGRQTDSMTGAEQALDLTPINTGFVAGIGGGIGAGPGRIAIDARYQRYLFPLSSGGDDVKSSHQFMVTVGYAFP